MKLNELKPPKGSRKDRKRVGRGQASGTGTTSGRGNKGQNSRSGGGVRPGFEGGQMPLQRRLPKRGFFNIFRTQVAEVNLRDLARFRSGTVVDEAKLKAAGVIKGRYEVIKLLGQGEIKKKLTVKVNQASKNAQAKIEAAGGKVELI
jgi:large subunit ribosomal protein L15